ncbi:MazG family protein, partial [Pseudokineococcus marinus]
MTASADGSAVGAAPGARLLELVAVMDRLRSPGGCPWDAEQTHASLAPYALEEAYEVVEAVESGSPEHLREELGDLLLQVVFHARVAQEAPEGERFDVDDVAAGIVAKLVHRHPHVFGAEAGGSADDALSAADVEAGWEARKRLEKGRASAMDGVPAALPALARAAKLLGRARRAG